MSDRGAKAIISCWKTGFEAVKGTFAEVKRICPMKLCWYEIEHVSYCHVMWSAICDLD